ncbi:MAG: hypothetical protein GY845_38310 [Planctomycetes bacterium]|nr:hypothetical protein [Planctomycetota bacterium]
MPNWVERFEEHAIHNSISDMDEVLESVHPIAQNDTSALEDFLRLQQVHVLVKKALTNVDPVLVPIHPLDHLQQAYQTQINQLNNYESNQNVAHITKAVNQADGILLQLYQLYTITTPEDIQGIREYITSFRKSAQGNLVALNKETNELRESQTALTSNIEKMISDLNSQKDRIDSLVDQFQQTFDNDELQRRNQTESMRTEQANLFEQASDERQKSFQNQLDEQAQILTRFQQNQDQTCADFYDVQQQKASAFIDTLENLKADAEKLVNVISNTGMIGGYQRIANDEHRSALFWRVFTVGSMLGLIGFAIMAFFATEDGDTDWGTVITRIFVAATFGILAAFCARQASQHWEAERKNRKMELELASIDPYLIKLPEEIRHSIKQDLAVRLFGQKESTGKKKNDETTGTSLDLVRLALEAILKERGG